MAKPQPYVEHQWIDRIDRGEKQCITIIDRLEQIKTEFEAVNNEADANPNTTTDMATLANQANAFVNASAYTGFITYVKNALGIE